MVMEQIILIYGEKIYLNANLWMDIFMGLYERKNRGRQEIFMRNNLQGMEI